MLQAVLFDLDGTMADSDPIHLGVFQVMLGEQGLVVDEAMFRDRICGRTNQAILNDLLPHFSQAEALAFSEAKEQRFRDLARSQLQPVAGLMPLLDWIQARGLGTAVVTNAPRLNAEFMLQGLGLSARFDHIILGEDLPRAKPDPLPYQTALDKLGLEPSAALVFEDSPSGIQAAVAAGIPTVGVMSNHGAERLLGLGARMAIANFTDPRLAELGLLT
ncbi:MAG: HAD-IA family hydrolase [Synechococcales cyanobacterium RM1_1_8]|nr:HAD-IA family hydrolase [Synechococcales cyanobacterium RM1_1_8]